MQKYRFLKIFTALFLGTFGTVIFGQNITDKIGRITYISSQNIYVQFDNTEGMKQGDTLFVKVKGKLIPALRVNFLSTRSCAGIKISDAALKVDDQLHAKVHITDQAGTEIIEPDTFKNFQSEPQQQGLEMNKTTLRNVKRSVSNGRFTLQSYSSLNPGNTNSLDQRWRYTFLYDAERIGETGFSFSSYFNYAYRVADWSRLKQKPLNNLKVYDLSLGYDFNEMTFVKLGRYLNPKISNLSSVDGVQFQAAFSNFFSGILVGSRPDFSTLGFNSKLFEYGAYIGRIDSAENGIMESTVGFFQQTNNYKTDRRFVYFQHNNSLLRELYFSLSSELDLFAIENKTAKTKPSLTSFYFTSRYAPSRLISFSLSYDARKNVIYYETFKNFADSIIENETRQGIRLGTNIRPLNNIFIGLNAGYRFLKKDIKPSKNFNGFITYSQIPIFDASSTVSYSRLISNYIDGTVLGVRLTKFISLIDYSVSVSYTNVSYDYLSSIAKLEQNNFSAELSGRIIDQIYLSCSFEGIFEEHVSYKRILFDLSLRF